jgi:hypothetical protein
MRSRRTPVLAFFAVFGLVGCTLQSLPALPPIPVYEIAPIEERAGLAIAPSTARDPLAELGASKRVSLTATDADARELLLSLARQADVAIIVSPDVVARVSVRLAGIPAGEAMRAVISQAGLSVLAAAPESGWPPVVFHQLPYDVNAASAATIAARFGVSGEMARWIVRSRAGD